MIPVRENSEVVIICPDAWYIYLQNWMNFRANGGKYSSTMEHMGEISLRFLGIPGIPHKKTKRFEENPL